MKKASASSWVGSLTIEVRKETLFRPREGGIVSSVGVGRKSSGRLAPAGERREGEREGDRE